MPLWNVVQTAYDQLEERAKTIIEDLQKKLKEKTDELAKQSSNKNTDPKSN